MSDLFGSCEDEFVSIRGDNSSSYFFVVEPTILDNSQIWIAVKTAKYIYKEKININALYNK